MRLKHAQVAELFVGVAELEYLPAGRQARTAQNQI